MPRHAAKDRPHPFVKWVGGKGQLVAELLERAPLEFGGYHEPFVGGGALFFALQRAGRLAGKQVVLSDVNQELIDAYCAIRDQVEAVIRQLRTHRYDHDHFYEVRGWDPATLAPAKNAARLIFLNKTGFNGLYRVNSKGKFNVPFGRYKNPLICDAVNLRAVSVALAGVEILCQPFTQAAARARKGDFVYFDPPYVPLSSTAYFTAYARNGFGPADQLRLADAFAGLAKRGVRVMLSNSDTPDVHTLYKGFRLDTVQARRNVNSRQDRRGPVGELIVLGHDPEPEA